MSANQFLLALADIVTRSCDAGHPPGPEAVERLMDMDVVADCPECSGLGKGIHPTPGGYDEVNCPPCVGRGWVVRELRA